MILPVFRTMPKLEDGEPIQLKRRGNEVDFVHKCCECGMRHDVKVTVGKKNFILRFWRINETKRSRK